MIPTASTPPPGERREDTIANARQGGRRRLRFGVMLNRDSLQSWQTACLAELIALEGAEPALVIMNAARNGNSILDRLRAVRPRHLLFEGYSRIFGRCPATRQVSVDAPLAGVPRISCVVERRWKYSEHFSKDDLPQIAAYDLDFILRFGFGIVRGDILGVPRYGVWSFHHDDEQKIRGAPAAFWPILRGDETSGAVLQRLTERLDGGVILRKRLVPTVATSYARNADRVFSAGVGFPAEVCRDIIAGDAGYLEGPPSATDAPVYRRPTNGQMLRFFIVTLRNRWRRRAAPLIEAA